MRLARWLILSGLVAAVLLLSWAASRPGRSESAPAPAREAPTSAPAPVAAAPPPAIEVGNPPAPPVVAAPVRQGAHGEKAPPDVQAQIDGAREHLREAARPCFVDRPRKQVPIGKFDDTVQEISYRYTVRTVDGRRRVDDVVVMSSTIAESEVEACIVKSFRSASWRVTGPSDDLAVGDKLRLGDLLAPPSFDVLDEGKPPR
jgi:hypothetical protein